MQMNFDPYLLEQARQHQDRILQTSILDRVLRKFRSDKKLQPAVISTDREVMEALQSVSRALNQAISKEAVLAAAGDGIIHISHSDRAAIYLWDGRSSVACCWSERLPPEHLQWAQTPEALEIFSNLFENRGVVAMPEISSMAATVFAHKLFKSVDLGEMVLLPMSSQGEIIGAVGCYFDLAHEVGSRVIEALTLLINQLAIRLDLIQRQERLEGSFLEVSLELAHILDVCGLQSNGSRNRLERAAVKTAVSLGCDLQEQDDIKWAARLHDIGKVVVPKKILRKPGPLTEAEWEIVKRHPVEGERILKPLPQFRGVGRIIRSLREHFNGGGYPDGLQGSEIPIGARVLSITDAYQHMTLDRPFQTAFTHGEALKELKSCCSGQFDPGVMAVFLKNGYEAGALTG